MLKFNIATTIIAFFFPTKPTFCSAHFSNNLIFPSFSCYFKSGFLFSFSLSQPFMICFFLCLFVSSLKTQVFNVCSEKNHVKGHRKRHQRKYELWKESINANKYEDVYLMWRDQAQQQTFSNLHWHMLSVWQTLCHWVMNKMVRVKVI